MKRTAYHHEDWVAGQIEAWDRAPSAGLTGGKVFDDALLLRAELNRAGGTRLLYDIDGVGRTNQALDDLPLDQRCALVVYHTKRTLTLGQLARVLKASRDTVKKRLYLAHHAFYDGWHAAKQRAINNDRHRPESRASA